MRGVWRDGKRADGYRERRRLASLNYDLEQWREYQEGKGGKDWVEGFKLMDADGGAAWDLATQVRASDVSVACARSVLETVSIYRIAGPVACASRTHHQTPSARISTRRSCRPPLRS